MDEWAMSIEATSFLVYIIRYAIYRFVLYTNEFKRKHSMKDTKNIFCPYLLLLESIEHAWFLLAGVRGLTLFPYSQDPNKSLNIIIDDTVRKGLDGFPTVDSYRNICTVFLDTVPFPVTLSKCKPSQTPWYIQMSLSVIIAVYLCDKISG